MRLSQVARFAASGGKEDVASVIRRDVAEFPVMIYMKGTPDSPQCGFSKRAVQLLEAAGVDVASRDVLQDPELREGIKKFTNWPTIPQVFIGGEFVGGSDTLLEMFKNGDLDKLLDAKKITRATQRKD